MCSGEGSSNRNRLVSWLIWSVSINLRAYFVFGSTNVTFFFFFWSKKTFARMAVTVTRPNPTKTGMIWNRNRSVCTQMNDIIRKQWNLNVLKVETQDEDRNLRTLVTYLVNHAWMNNASSNFIDSLSERILEFRRGRQ